MGVGRWIFSIPNWKEMSLNNHRIIMDKMCPMDTKCPSPLWFSRQESHLAVVWGYVVQGPECWSKEGILYPLSRSLPIIENQVSGAKEVSEIFPAENIFGIVQDFRDKPH